MYGSEKEPEGSLHHAMNPTFRPILSRSSSSQSRPESLSPRSQEAEFQNSELTKTLALHRLALEGLDLLLQKYDKQIKTLTESNNLLLLQIQALQKKQTKEITQRDKETGKLITELVTTYERNRDIKRLCNICSEPLCFIKAEDTHAHITLFTSCMHLIHTYCTQNRIATCPQCYFPFESYTTVSIPSHIISETKST